MYRPQIPSPVTNKRKTMSLPDELFVRITLGNDAMRTSSDVAAALRKVASRLEENGYLEDEEIQSLVRGIMDRNDSTVGEWGFR